MSKPAPFKYFKVKFAEYQHLTGVCSCFRWQFPDIPDSYGEVSNVLKFTARLQSQIRKAGFKYDVLTDDGDGKCTIQVGIKVNKVYVSLSDWKGWEIVGWSTRELTDVEKLSIARFLKKIYVL